MMTGRIHSFQSLGTADGPGVRAVVFMQGCPLRCACCHNPDTWDFNGGKEATPEEIFLKIKRLKNYFGESGGVTVSGGEPLMQPEFIKELFTLCKNDGITTAIDTSGCVLNDDIKNILKLTDTVLLDYKYITNELYKTKVGCEKTKVDEFLEYLNSQNIDTWIRQVIIKDLNNNESSVSALKELREKYSCIKKIELLPFKKLCIEKYEKLKLQFPLEDTPETTKQEIENLTEYLK
ncbi:MAG: pyruvate formate lyase-activating protein [Ruminococcaceae bacterium]|nr:pyruvate formate lyase-activating protein [Oscillospiraceae bacterium]